MTVLFSVKATPMSYGYPIAQNWLSGLSDSTRIRFRFGRVSAFAGGKDGRLTALPGTIVGTNPAGATNLDIAVSSDGKFLYTLNSGNGSVGIFSIQSEGSLNNIVSTDGLPASAGLNGIVAN